jgi:hypothetical protein
MRKLIGIIVLLALGLAMSGCDGANAPGSGNINGTWFATLTDSNGDIVDLAYSFSTTFTETSNNGLDVTNFTFSVPGPCFAPYSADQYSETGSFILSGNSNGNVTGTFAMTITTEFPAANNVLTLNGTVNGNAISGTWNATGLTGCSGNGTFTIQPPMQGG